MSHDQKEGRFVAFLNKQKQPGDKRPAFEGKISLPEDANERRLVLWSHPTKTGGIIMNGRVTKSAMEQIEELTRRDPVVEAPIEDTATSKNGPKVSVDPHEIQLFSNTRKQPEQANHPDYWGYYNPGEGSPWMRLAVWAKTDARGKVMLSGSVKVDERELEPEIERQRQRGRGR